MDQITITRKDFRYKAAKLIAELMKKADEDQDMSAMGRVVLIMMHASMCADLEQELFGEETKEE